MDKTPHINTPKEQYTKIVKPEIKEEWDLEYHNFNRHETEIINEAWIEDFCKRYVQWAINDNKAFNYKFFYMKEGIDPMTIQKWKKIFPLLDRTLSYVKVFIGIRREQKALTNQHNASVTMRIQPVYDNDLHDLMEWEASLRDKNEEQTNITILKQPLTDTANAAMINSQYFKVTESESFALKKSESSTLRKSPEEVAGNIKKLTGRVDQGSNLK